MCLPVAPACRHANPYMHISSAQGRCMGSLFLYRNQVMTQSCSGPISHSFFFILSYHYTPVHLILNLEDLIVAAFKLHFKSKLPCINVTINDGKVSAKDQHGTE